MNATRTHVGRNPIDAFAEHLAEQFQTSAERALERVNRELKDNPLTRDIQLQLRPEDALLEPR